MQMELFAAAATSPAHRVPCLRKEREGTAYYANLEHTCIHMQESTHKLLYKHAAFEVESKDTDT